ncbi:hypothetical protein NP233_g3792 [Leucocoprinus birnbaumii]|uniref:Hydrophobin n=1 Tax=Leucocoprinus birnbaumii TaxID=56174 RepID=A0AAD5VVX1_9AGAR|nr:hypothetical protein NP233_g3792 [Leucocoprinus birnbaumii]
MNAAAHSANQMNIPEASRATISILFRPRLRSILSIPPITNDSIMSFSRIIECSESHKKAKNSRHSLSFPVTNFSLKIAMLSKLIVLALAASAFAQFQTCSDDQVTVCCDSVIDPKDVKHERRLEYFGVDVSNVTGVVGYECEPNGEGNLNWFWCPGKAAACCSELQFSPNPDREGEFPTLAINCQPPAPGTAESKSGFRLNRGW